MPLIHRLVFPQMDYSKIRSLFTTYLKIENNEYLDLLSEQYINAFNDCINVYNQEMSEFCSDWEQRLTDESFKDNLIYAIRRIVIYNLSPLMKLKNNNFAISHEENYLRPFLEEGNFNIDEIVSFLDNIYRLKTKNNNPLNYNDMVDYINSYIVEKLKQNNYCLDIFAKYINIVIDGVNNGTNPILNPVPQNIIKNWFGSHVAKLKGFYENIKNLKDTEDFNLNKFHKIIKDDLSINYNESNITVFKESLVSLLNDNNLSPQAINKIIGVSEFDVLNKFANNYIKKNPEEINYNVLFRLCDYTELGSNKTANLFGEEISSISNLSSLIDKLFYIGDPNMDYNEFKDHELLKNYCKLLKETSSINLPACARKLGGFKNYYQNVTQTFNGLLSGDWSNMKAGYFIDTGVSVSGFLSTEYFKTRFDEKANIRNNVLLFGQNDTHGVRDYFTNGARRFKNLPYDEYSYLEDDKPYYYPEDLVDLVIFLSEVDEEEISKYMFVSCRNEELLSKFYTIFIKIKKLLFRVKEDFINRSKDYYNSIEQALNNVFRLNDRLILEKVIEKLMYVTIPNNKKLNSRLINIFKTYLYELHAYDRPHIGVNNFLEQYRNDMSDPEFVALLGSDEAATIPLPRLKKLLNCRENAKKQYGKNYQNTLKFLDNYFLNYGFDAMYNKDDIQKALDEKKLTQDNLEILKMVYYSEIDEDEGSEDYPEFDEVLEFFEQTNNSEVLKNNKQSIPNDIFNIGKYTFEITAKNDKINFVLGNLTSCCQSIGGLAEDCVVDGLTNENAGFMTVYETKKDKFKGLVLQSYWWISKDRAERKTLVLDNIEGRGNCDVEEMRKNYVAWAKYIKQKYGFVSVVMGIGYADFKVGTKLNENHKEMLLINRMLKENQVGNMYTDLTPGVNLIAKNIIEKLIKLSAKQL